MNMSDKFSWEGLKNGLRKLRSVWQKLPEQIKRLTVILAIFIFALISARNMLVPSDFGEYGHYRASAVDDIIKHPVKFAGREACAECHDDIAETKNSGYHRDVSCEVCHGPGAAHIEDPESVQLKAPRGRTGCPLCHEYLPSRPTGFPQIVSESHNPINPCITCHDPHQPVPPETPSECSACHAQIARTKMLSHHVYVPCTKCHETPEKHKLSPRDYLPSKPKTREFCGQCHATDADSERGIPRVDLQTHETRYVCWQCHYPHLPEAR